MKQIKYKVLRTGEIVICEDFRDRQVIEGIEYVTVRKPDSSRTFLMRLEALVQLERSK